MADPRTMDRLGHILAAITTIGDYTAGKTLADFQSDRLLADAVERNIERLSEASRHLTDELKAGYPDIPWREIADIGNVLRHAYDRVAPERIWQIITDDLAHLGEAVEAMIDTFEKDGE